MRRAQLCVVFGIFALQIHLPEHVECGFLPDSSTRSSFGLDTSSYFPSCFSSLEPVSFTIVACSNDLVLSSPDKRRKRQKLRTDANHSTRRQLRSARVHHRDARVVCRESQRLTRRAKRNAMDPASRVIKVLPADRIKWQPLTPHTRLRPRIHPLDKPREHPRVTIRAPGRQQHRVRMPRHSRDRALDRLLQMLAHPPVVLLLEVTYSNNPRAAPNRKLLLVRAPPHERRGAVDPQEHQRRLPARRRRLPHVRVAVLAAGYDHAGAGRDVHACYGLVVALELVLERVFAGSGAGAGVEFDVVGAGDGEGLVVGGEGVVGDGGVEEVVDFWGCHVGGCAVGGALYYHEGSRLRVMKLDEGVLPGK